VVVLSDCDEEEDARTFRCGRLPFSCGFQCQS
jgi:hypothetical protein